MENNQNLPDTQIVDSQTEAFSEESIYDRESPPPVWAKLRSYLSSSIVFELKHDKGWFGREDPTQNEKMDVWIFSMKNCNKRYLEKISKCHFVIEREPSEDSGKNSKNMNPAYITCYGRNGIFVNNDKMTPEARRILSENDVIKLTNKLTLFAFNYTDWNPTFKELLPETCVQKYYVGREIGSGGCGVVRICYNVNTFHKYAMKIIVKQKYSLSSSVIANDGSIDNEVKIMKSVQHPNVLSLTDFYESPNSAVIIMDYLEGGDMLNRITQYNPNMKRLSEEDSKFYFLQACHGLKYLHDHSITHRDIKPDNILLQSLERDTILKISDFGLSKLVALGPMKTVCGTQLYVAPEINSGVYNNKVDIWSLGCVLFAMLSGTLPFHQADNKPDIKVQIKEAKVEFVSRAWNQVSPTAKSLILKMLQKNPTRRPTIENILEHPWLDCQTTLKRLERLHDSNKTVVDSSEELENTMVNITLDDTDKTIMTPPPKRRRIK